MGGNNRTGDFSKLMSFFNTLNTVCPVINTLSYRPKNHGKTDAVFFLIVQNVTNNSTTFDHVSQIKYYLPDYNLVFLIITIYKH